jgi:hypothetical protein
VGVTGSTSGPTSCAYCRLVPETALSSQVRSVFRTWSLDETREWLQAPDQVRVS